MFSFLKTISVPTFHGHGPLLLYKPKTQSHSPFLGLGTDSCQGRRCISNVSGRHLSLGHMPEIISQWRGKVYSFVDSNPRLVDIVAFRPIKQPFLSGDHRETHCFISGTGRKMKSRVPLSPQRSVSNHLEPTLHPTSEGVHFRFIMPL